LQQANSFEHKQPGHAGGKKTVVLVDAILSRAPENCRIRVGAATIIFLSLDSSRERLLQRF
jgi:hypothetical protein